MPHSPDEAMLAATLHIFNAVERACALPPRSAVSPVRLVPPDAAPVKFDDEVVCSNCGEIVPGVRAHSDFCCDDCEAEYAWFCGSDCDHGEEG